MKRYEGKKVVIIGGTSGMGLATAKMLLDGGARVLVTGRSKEGLESAQKELGNEAIVASSDARSLTDLDALAGASEEEFQAFMESKFLPYTTAYFQINSLYVDTGKHKVLIDNGMGPYLGPSGGHLPDHLRNLGVAPEEIDTIIISHAHLDHVFGTLAPDDSQVFPNARYVIGEQEWAYWMKPDIELGNLLPEEWKQLIVEGAKRHLGGIKERVEFVKPGLEVVTGITAVEAFGHTPGMLAFNISSGSEGLFYSADALHHFALSIAHPEWHVGFDNDQDLGVRTRLRVLNQVIAERSLVLVPHFPFPGLGQIAKQGHVRSWEPTVWQW